MIIIGERINSSRKHIAEAVTSRDAEFIHHEAKMQADAGAQYLEVNAGSFLKKEADYLKWLIEEVQKVTDIPLCIDSPDPQVIKSVLPMIESTPIINSITLEPSRLEGTLALVVEYKSKVIALCQSEDSIAETTKAKIEMAQQLVEKTKSADIPMDDIFIDPLLYPLSTNTESATETLNAIEKIMNQFPNVHTTCGLTNVSYGLPNRKLVNRTFLTAAITRGLDSAIFDPTDRELYGALKAALMISGNDEFCMEYIMAYRQGSLE
jgi:cobalamin-dependent methionine synthase I